MTDGSVVLENGRLPQDADAPRAVGGGTPYHEALTCLVEAEVRHCLLRDRLEDVDRCRDLDLLIHPEDGRVTVAALARAGFLPRRDRRLRGKCVFLRYVHGRFYTLDVHAGFFQNGIEYMDARRALARAERAGAGAWLAPEDEFLHLLLHNLLGKKELQEKHVARLRALHAAGLDPERLGEQARISGLRPEIDLASASFETLLADSAAWHRMQRRVRRHLVRRPGNAIGAWRHAHGDRLRLRRRAVVLALLGPDGSGKTSFADALEAQLRDTPLRAGRVYMGCWGHDHLPMRQARRLVPPQVSHARMLLRRCGVPLGLTEEERAYLVGGRGSIVRLGFAALRYAVKNPLFHLALAAEMTFRYGRGIARSRRPLVITDRYVYDLEFRQGKIPFAHGAWHRRLWYRFFPAPDGILYLTTPYDLVEQRKPQLDRQQFETMDRVFRRVLRPYQPLEIVSDAPPDDMVHAFLTAHWERLLERCNRRA